MPRLYKHKSYHLLWTPYKVQEWVVYHKHYKKMEDDVHEGAEVIDVIAEQSQETSGFGMTYKLALLKSNLRFTKSMPTSNFKRRQTLYVKTSFNDVELLAKLAFQRCTFLPTILS